MTFLKDKVPKINMLSEVENEDAVSILETELETLHSIYINEIEVNYDSCGIPNSIAIQLYPSTADNVEEQYVRLSLIFLLKPEYPDIVPEIVIRNPRGLSDEEIDGITEDLVSKAEERKGCTMLFELIEAAKEHLTAGNIPSCHCTICLYGFSSTDVFTKTTCYHYFHSYCLARYTKHALKEAEEEKISHKEEDEAEIQQLQVFCPVCRIPISFPDFEDKFPPPSAAQADKFTLTKEMQELQEKMATLYEKQKSQGGIIDIEAEKNKFLLEISAVPASIDLETQDAQPKDVPTEDIACSGEAEPVNSQESKQSTHSLNSVRCIEAEPLPEQNDSLQNTNYKRYYPRNRKRNERQYSHYRKNEVGENRSSGRYQKFAGSRRDNYRENYESSSGFYEEGRAVENSVAECEEIKEPSRYRNDHKNKKINTAYQGNNCNAYVGERSSNLSKCYTDDSEYVNKDEHHVENVTNKRYGNRRRSSHRYWANTQHYDYPVSESSAILESREELSKHSYKESSRNARYLGQNTGSDRVASSLYDGSKVEHSNNNPIRQRQERKGYLMNYSNSTNNYSRRGSSFAKNASKDLELTKDHTEQIARENAANKSSFHGGHYRSPNNYRGFQRNRGTNYSRRPRSSVDDSLSCYSSRSVEVPEYHDQQLESKNKISYRVSKSRSASRRKYNTTSDRTNEFNQRDPFKEYNIVPESHKQGKDAIHEKKSNRSSSSILEEKPASLQQVSQNKLYNDTPNETCKSLINIEKKPSILPPPPGFANPAKKFQYGLPSVKPPPGFHQS